MNSYSFSGRLGKAPELRTAKDSGNAYTLMSVAVNTGRDEAIWWLCKAFGRQAETICMYLNKGDGLEIVGHFRQEIWSGEHGDEEKLIVYVDRFSFCPTSKSQEGAAAVERSAQPRQQNGSPQQQRRAPQQQSQQRAPQRPAPQRPAQPQRGQMQQGMRNAAWPPTDDDRLNPEDIDF